MTPSDEVNTTEKYWIDHLLHLYAVKPGDEVKFTTVTADGSYQDTAIVTCDHGDTVEARTASGEKLRLERKHDGSLSRLHLEHFRVVQAIALVLYGRDEAPHPVAATLTREDITDDDVRSVMRFISDRYTDEISERDLGRLVLGGEGG